MPPFRSVSAADCRNPFLNACCESFSQTRPPCSVPPESPILYVVTTTPSSLEASSILCSNVCTVGKQKDGSPVPMFTRITVLAKSSHPSPPTAKQLQGASQTQLERERERERE